MKGIIRTKPTGKPETKKEKQAREELNKICTEMVAELKFKRPFQKTSNPIYVFEAFRFYRDKGIEPAEWIFSYFDSVANGLLDEVGNREIGLEGGARAAFIVYEILGMKRDIFNDYVKQKKYLEVVSDFTKAKEKFPDRSHEDIIMPVSPVRHRINANGAMRF